MWVNPLRRWVYPCCVLIASAVVGCSSEMPARPAPTSEPRKIAAPPPNPDPVPDKAQPANKADAAAFPDELKNKAQMATVRIWNGAKQVDGSGVFIGSERNCLYILTANHVVDGADGNLTVYAFSDGMPSAEYKGRSVNVEAQSAGSDLALLSVATRDRAPAILPLCSPKQIPDGMDFRALSVGCELQRPITAMESVKGKQTIRMAGKADTHVVFQIEGSPNSGRSGGPLVDHEGRVIGICSGVGDGKGYYIHPDEIHKLLSKNYAWLWETPQRP